MSTVASDAEDASGEPTMPETPSDLPGIRDREPEEVAPEAP